MGITIEVSVVEVAGSLRMTIPSHVAKALQIKKGDKVIVDLQENTMLVKKKLK